jgi:hypothetical protein
MFDSRQPLFHDSNEVSRQLRLLHHFCSFQFQIQTLYFFFFLQLLPTNKNKNKKQKTKNKKRTGGVKAKVMGKSGDGNG